MIFIKFLIVILNDIENEHDDHEKFRQKKMPMPLIAG
jgi:hypothetical protein